MTLIYWNTDILFCLAIIARINFCTQRVISLRNSLVRDVMTVLDSFKKGLAKFNGFIDGYKHDS